MVVKDGVDRRGAHHIRVIARGADGKAQPRLQEQPQQHRRRAVTAMAATTSSNCPGQGRARQQVASSLVKTVDRLIHIQHGGVAHDRDVDRNRAPVLTIMPASKLLTPIFVCRTRGDEAPRAFRRPWRRRCARYGCPAMATAAPTVGAQREAAVGGQVADVQHGIAEEQAPAPSGR